jgi:hypothetical protein
MRLFIFLFCCTISLAQQTSKVDFITGQAFIGINIDRKEVVGAINYDFEVLKPIDTIRIDAKNMQISDVKINEKPVTFKNNTNGLVNTMDNTIPNNSCEDPATCNIFASPAKNALRRLRSAGMIRQKFDSKNRPKYCTDTTQYLVSRNITFDQNQFQYPISDPKYCVTYKPNNKQFAQQGAVTSSSLIAKVKYDTVNTAARMEQNSEAGKINLSQSTYELLKDKFTCTYRGEIQAKNKGALAMYFLEE